MNTVSSQEEIQRSLFDDVPFGDVFEPDYPKEATLFEKFVLWHRMNPQVYFALRRMALNMRAKGIRRYGLQALVEVLRFDYTMQTNGDEFKINNSYVAFYARLLMERNAQLAGFFEIREQRQPIDQKVWDTL